MSYYWILPTRLTHWGRLTHICLMRLTIIGSDNGLSPDWRQAIIWTNTGILLIGPLGTNLSEIQIKILTFSFKKMRLNMSSATWRPFCLGLNELNLEHSSIRTVVPVMVTRPISPIIEYCQQDESNPNCSACASQICWWFPKAWAIYDGPCHPCW